MVRGAHKQRQRAAAQALQDERLTHNGALPSSQGKGGRRWLGCCRGSSTVLHVAAAQFHCDIAQSPGALAITEYGSPFHSSSRILSTHPMSYRLEMVSVPLLASHSRTSTISHARRVGSLGYHACASVLRSPLQKLPPHRCSSLNCLLPRYCC